MKELGTRDSVVVIVSLHDWSNGENINQIGIFLGNFSKRMIDEGVPVIIVEHISASYVFLQIVSSNVGKILSMRDLSWIRSYKV